VPPARPRGQLSSGGGPGASLPADRRPATWANICPGRSAPRSGPIGRELALVPRLTVFLNMFLNREKVSGQVLEVCDRVSLIQGGQITLDKRSDETSAEELTEMVVADYREARQERQREVASGQG
jgi:hypothetical protein